MRFRDRTHAGEELAARLRHHPVARHDPVVLGLARGGVPVAAPVAAALGADLDVLVVRKLGAPGRPELGLGAIGEEGVRVVDPALVRDLHVTDAHLERVVAAETAELERRVQRYRGDRPPVPVAGRAVVLVDDGIATGGSVRAGLEVLAARGAAEVVVAVPVASEDVPARIGLDPEAVVIVHRPRRMSSVGAAYRDFAATTDEEVVAALRT